MNEREFLNNSIVLTGSSDGQQFSRTFRIQRKIKEGASVICYEAYHETSGRGILREFYPRKAWSLMRGADGQLLHDRSLGAAAEQFEEDLKRYLKPYELLLQIRRMPENRDLQTCIPEYEIYHGGGDHPDCARTAYIWTSDPESVTFASICEGIRREPKKRPEYHLVKVLSAMVSLTECIRALHSAGLVHRDIKPGNFGFASRRSEALTESVSLFDIDTVCAMYPLPRDRVISEGFTEPEALDLTAGRYSAGCQTDIYSIGATLFSALVLTPQTEAAGYVYRPEFGQNLRELVSQSSLITASEANSHPKLRGNLTRVLERCLCPRENRYPNCDELLEDLNRALRYALPSELARRHIAGERWVLADAEQSLDQKKEKNSALALHYHLYEHPLYRCCPEGAADLNVLVVGFGSFGRRFADLALEVGQMRERSLSVTVISDDPDDRTQYLADRPALAEFFAVDAPMDETHDYGQLRFAPVRSLERENRQQNFDVMQDLVIRCCDEERPPHYVFIALGEDELNRSAAEAVREAAEVCDLRCTVSFVWEGETLPRDLGEGLIPIPVNADVQQTPLHAQAERMAFQVHKIWSKDQNLTHSALRAEYRKPYNHSASVSNVLSLKYKLFSIGIDLDAMTPDRAAARFVAEKKTWKNQLVWMEHRRWVTEKLCDGWQRMTDLEALTPGSTKDERRKRHICIVRSEPNQNLAAKYRATHYLKWDTATEAELKELDELDRLSVAVHRMYVRKAAQLREKGLAGRKDIEAIRALVSEDQAAMAAFRDWETCVREICGGDLRKVTLYESLRRALVDAAGNLPVTMRAALRDQLQAFGAVFGPVLESTRHRDFKQDDVDMVDNIPAVLTCRESMYLAIPYDLGDNTRVFSNVAAAAVADPARVIWLVYLDERRALAELTATLHQVAGFLDRKNLRCAVEFVIGYDPRLAQVEQKTFDDMKAILGTRLRQIKPIPVKTPMELAAQMEEYLSKRRAAQPALLLERNQTKLSYLLQGAGVCERFDSYRFDAERMSFAELRGCEYLGYIRKKSGITVSDMLSLRRSAGESSQPEFFSEYQKLWERYRKNAGVWKMVCTALQAYSEQHDVLAVFKKRADRTARPDAEAYRYLVPYRCSASVKKLLRELQRLEIIDPGSTVTGYTTDSCEVLIRERGQNKPLFDAILASHYALMEPSALRIHPNTGRREVVVSFDDLVVKSMTMPADRRLEFQELMRWFSQIGFVTNLIFSGDTVRFTYATGQIKELMTTAGKILEIYTYHRARETGKFDDVVSSYELHWEGSEVLSEFDCILTRGFQSLFVECKARTKIEQDYYYKLSSLTRQFGINARAVLIADTLERSGSDFTAVNDMQRQRGEMMDVITISDPAEIQNIGKTLLSILDGSYERNKKKEL